MNWYLLSIAEQRAAWEAQRFVYHYEPDVIRFADRFEGKVLWRGPHRFAHPADLERAPSSLYGHLYGRDKEMLAWVRQTVDNEGYGKRSRWCRSGFQYIFREENDAMLFRLRWC
jgi:hypothetical protein